MWIRGPIKLALIAAALATATAMAQPFSEAPSIAERVERGELPPVAERLPRSPLVADVGEVGTYGGDLYQASPNAGQPHVWIRAGLLEWPIGEFAEPGPGLAETLEVNDDSTRFTFTLREGLRWSDGVPFTSADLAFWWEHIILNDELTPTVPSWLRTGGAPARFSAPDAGTVVFEFAAPNPLFPKVIAFRGGINLFEGVARHYLEAFHPAFTDADTLAARVAESGFENWVQLFRSRFAPQSNPELPTMNAWQLVQAFPGERMVLERNPYYYKVDSIGQQLPYMDRVVVLYAPSPEVIRLMAIDGQLDLQYTFLGFDQYPLLRENEASGGYRTQQVATTSGVINLMLNQNIADASKQTLLQDVRVRLALSHAIDRQAINDLHLFGLADIISPVVTAIDPYYAPGTGTNGTVYDPDYANELLDSAGLTARDANGWRLMPDGRPFELTIEGYPLAIGLNLIELTTMVAEYWQAIGVRAEARELDSALWSDRAAANQLEIPVVNSQELGWDLDPLWFVPTVQWTYWAPEYGRWYDTGGTAGIEPPAEIAELQRALEALTSEPDPARRLEHGQSIMRAHEENLWMLTIVRVPFLPMVVNERLRNVAEGGAASYYHQTEAFTWPEQLFYVDGRRE